LFRLGELLVAQEHFEKSIALADHATSNTYAFSFASDPRIGSLSYTVWNLWLLGYMDRALKRGYETLAFARELSHPFLLAFALTYIVRAHQLRKEVKATQEQAEVLFRLGTEHGFAVTAEMGHIWKGWALAEQGQKEGIGQMQRGIAALRATGTSLLSSFLGLLAEACGKVERTEEGVAAIAEALAPGHEAGERFWDAELYRLKGQLTLQQFHVQRSKFNVASPELPTLNLQAEADAEACFRKALKIARRQSARSLELRATMGLARLLRNTGRRDEAHAMLKEIYNWFTEGFDTTDLKHAKALLDELSH
jgi:predicted ATPase